ncbi:MAG: hypothetical protein R2932_46610 [Caldilineaceae bacterium]
MVDRFGGPTAYSYVFDGQWGYLDHALSSSSLTDQVTNVAEWHINADEPSVLDYNTNFKSSGQVTSLYNDDEFRVSDHDPVLIDLNLDTTPPIGSCGGYTVHQTSRGYIAAPQWNGTILVGSRRNNTIFGSNGPDLILGLGGNDLITGKDGDDVICGGDGVDLLLGMAGNDILDGGDGNDVLNGGDGDYDQLIAGSGNDVLLDGDGVLSAQGDVGNDLLTIALRNGWRDLNSAAHFTGLAAGYGNDTVGLIVLGQTPVLLDITGDERDEPASTQEGKNDKLTLIGAIDPASSIIKFERQLVISDATLAIPAADAGAEYLTEPVGEEGEMGPAHLYYLPFIGGK